MKQSNPNDESSKSPVTSERGGNKFTTCGWLLNPDLFVLLSGNHHVAGAIATVNQFVETVYCEIRGITADRYFFEPVKALFLSFQLT